MAAYGKSRRVVDNRLGQAKELRRGTGYFTCRWLARKRHEVGRAHVNRELCSEDVWSAPTYSVDMLIPWRRLAIHMAPSNSRRSRNGLSKTIGSLEAKRRRNSHGVDVGLNGT